MKPRGAEPRTMIIGIDGATFTILDPLMESGHMPFLREFILQGTRAVLKSTVPPTTPPAWTTIMTGRSPGKHGIVDFFRPEKPGSPFLRFVSTRQLRCETIWSLLARQDRSAACLNFPVMSPPVAIKGYSIPGFVTWRHLRRSCYPEDLMDTLKTIPGFDLKIIAHDFGLEEKVVSGCFPGEAEEWIRYHTYKDRQWASVLKWLGRNDPCNVDALVLDSADRLQHVFYPLLDPDIYRQGLSAQDEDIRAHLLSHFRELDSMIAALAEAAGPEATVFIVSDHGFGPSRYCFYLNTFLERLGYLTWSGRADTIGEAEGDGSIEAVKNHGHLVDMERTIAYVNTPSSNGININVRDRDSSSGIAPEEYDRVVLDLRRELYGLISPEAGQQAVTGIWTRQQAFDGLETAPDLTLELWDHGLVSTVKSDQIIKPRTRCAGVHYPEGVFIARGPGIKAGAELDALNILDVAPSVLYSQGLAVPEDYEGRVPEEMIEPETLAARPVLRQEATPRLSGRAAADLEMDEQDMELIMKRLRGLGYME